MKQFLRKIFGTQVAEEKKVKVVQEGEPHWSIKARQKAFEAKEKVRKEKFDDLAKIYNDKLNQLISIYLTDYSLDEDVNKASFDTLSKEWKEIAYKVSQTTKIITLNPDGFEYAINKITLSKEFQDKLKKKVK